MIGCSLARFAKFQTKSKNFQGLEREKNVCRYFLLAASEMPEWENIINCCTSDNVGTNLANVRPKKKMIRRTIHSCKICCPMIVEKVLFLPRKLEFSSLFKELGGD